VHVPRNIEFTSQYKAMYEDTSMHVYELKKQKKERETLKIKAVLDHRTKW